MFQADWPHQHRICICLAAPLGLDLDYTIHKPDSEGTAIKVPGCPRISYTSIDMYVSSSA